MPAAATTMAVERAQAETAAVADSVSHQMVHGQAFEVALPDGRVNEWLACLPHLLPEGRYPLPPEWTEPAVRFEDGRLRIGAHYRDDRWEVILNLGITAGVSEDGRTLKIALADVRGGSLPISRLILERGLEPMLRNARRGHAHDELLGTLVGDLQSVDDLFTGVNIRNRFVWPNGERPFRIDSIALESGVLRLRLEPLAR